MEMIMEVKNTTSDKPTGSDIARYRANYLSEQEGAYLYNQLAEAESDAHLAELYRRLAAIEQRHSNLWKDYLTSAGETPAAYTPNWRIRTLLWIARHLGTGAVLSTVSSMEKNAMTDYDTQPEAVKAGLPADERSHGRLLSYLLSSTKGGIAGPLLAQFEGRHRSAGGNELRAAVLGASDGLTPNLSLVMGVAGATLTGHAVLIAGLAGLLAGAFSMSIDEWVSVQSARELNQHQIAIERQELQEAPKEEQEEHVGSIRHRRRCEPDRRLSPLESGRATGAPWLVGSRDYVWTGQAHRESCGVGATRCRRSRSRKAWWEHDPAPHLDKATVWRNKQ